MPDPRATTLGDALTAARRRFETAGIDAPPVQARALLAHALGLDRAGLLARLREPLDAAAAATFEECVLRRLAHEPLQYILGRAHFLDFSVAVGPGVFIPRPETEQLVEAALAVWPAGRDLAIDLCCGSGVIAVALARARSAARVVAIDIAPRPLAATQRNVRQHGLQDRVQVCGADLLAPLAVGTDLGCRPGVIVCNPPYAARGDVVQPEVVEYEPSLAWEAGPSGSEVYARVIPQAAGLLASGSVLLFELGYDQADPVRQLLADDGRWRDVEIAEDFQHIPRVLTVYRA